MPKLKPTVCVPQKVINTVCHISARKNVTLALAAANAIPDAPRPPFVLVARPLGVFPRRWLNRLSLVTRQSWQTGKWARQLHIAALDVLHVIRSMRLCLSSCSHTR